MNQLEKIKFKFSHIHQHAMMLLLGVCFMAISVCVVLYPVWNTRQDYMFGFLTPIFVLYVMFDRKELIASFFTKKRVDTKELNKLTLLTDLLFVAIFFCGIIMFLVFAFMFYLTKNHGVPGFSMTFAFSFTFFSASYFASTSDLNGCRTSLKERISFVLLFIFPSFIWLISAPLFQVVESRISLFLLSIVAKVTYQIMDFLGFIVELHGNTIGFPNGNVGVADACSGIRSLTACIFAGSFLSAVFFDKLWKKLTLVISSMALAFFFNLCRALFLSFWAYENGPESISGIVHDSAGYIILLCTVGGLLAVVTILNLNPIPKELRDK